MRHVKDLLASHAPAATVLIRIAVGSVFVAEGIQKFLFSDDVGAGRFAKIGFDNAEALAAFVGATEIVCGCLVLVGFLTRIAAIPLVGVMLVAVVTTKIPILLGRDLGAFQVRQLDRYGFWAMVHESRTDWAMLLGAIFLLIVGAGRLSVDAVLTRRGDSANGS